ncbi:MAG: hypothetical protein L0H31_03980 [Nocardioidaceae bacterium]|nr:hypothetical protein [Nocardioidaceae bacterium]
MISYVAAAPAADIVTTATNLFDDLQTALLAIGGAAIALIIVKMLFKAPTLMAAFAAILMGAVVLWGLSMVDNPSVRAPLNDTIDEYSDYGMAPPDLLTAPGDAAS